MGRMTALTERNSNSTVLLTRAMTYDRDNRVTDQTDVTYGSSTTTTTTHNDYKAKVGSAWTGDDLGVITHSSSVTGSTTTHTEYNYAWWSSAKVSSQTISGQTNGSAVYTYDINGNLTGIVDTAVNRTLTCSMGLVGPAARG